MVDGDPIRYRVTTLLHRSFAVQLLLWGCETTMTARRASADALLAAVTFGDEGEGPVRWEGDTLIDERFGVSFRPPGPDWEYQAPGAAALVPDGTVHAWYRGKAGVFVVAAGGFPPLETVAAGSLLFSAVRTRLPTAQHLEAGPDGLRWDRGELAKRRACMLRLPPGGPVALLGWAVAHDTLGYAVIASAPAGTSDETLASWAEGFGFVE
jgi:hypothetical protein